MRPGLMFSQIFSKRSSWEKKNTKLSTIPITSKSQSPWTKHDLWQLYPDQKIKLSPYLVSDIIHISLIVVKVILELISVLHIQPLSASVTHSLYPFLLSTHTQSQRSKVIMESHWAKDDQRTQGNLTPKPQKSMISSLLHGLILSYSCLIHNRQTDQKTLTCSKRSSLGSL